MKRIGSFLAAVLSLTTGTALAPEPASAQGPAREEVVQFGSDYTLEAGESMGDLVVIGGSATIRGEVEGDAVVIGGSAELGGTGSVDGDFVVIGGSATVAAGAAVDGDLVVIGGGLDSPPGFRARGRARGDGDPRWKAWCPSSHAVSSRDG